jgi:proteasome lid subunit RPN8/RPN11
VTAGVKIPGLTRRTKEAIYEHVFSNDTHEVGGVLVGRLGDGALPTVSGSIAALEARGERASVTFTHDAWASVHEALERDFPGQQIIGWYHSHPGFGIFLSRHDLFIHENFFSDPRQIAYVVDPHAGTEGVFVWRDGEVTLLEERPAGRTGTGGTRSTRQERSTPNLRGIIALAAILGVMCGVTVELVLGGGDSRASGATTAVKAHGH